MTKAVDLISLTTYTNQLLESLAGFKTLLNEEKNLLKSNHIEQLFSLLETKSQFSDELDKTFKLFTLSHNQKDITLDQLIESEIYSSLSSDLQSKITDIIIEINKCYELNLSNAMAVQILNNINQVSLNILKGQTDIGTNSYGATGEKNIPKTKTSLGKA